jgi:hypothetical protein
VRERSYVFFAVLRSFEKVFEDARLSIDRLSSRPRKGARCPRSRERARR